LAQHLVRRPVLCRISVESMLKHA